MNTIDIIKRYSTFYKVQGF